MSSPSFKIIDLPKDNEDLIQQTADIVLRGFKEYSPAWPNMKAALKEVRESLKDGRISRIAVDKKGRVLGWVGGIREYGGYTWELHPLVVEPESRRRGIGLALVRDLEEQVKKRGGANLFTGTDDETGRTSLAGKDLYPDVLKNLMKIKNVNRHPFEFYQKAGFTVVGVIPDANAPGKPDIIMAKRIGQKAPGS